MVIAGLWHGANWTFVLWGAYHGGLLLVHHGLRANKLKWHGGWLGRIGTLLLVTLGWVLFRADNLHVAAVVYRKLFDVQTLFTRPSLPKEFLPVAVAALLWAMLAPDPYNRWLKEGRRPGMLAIAVLGLLAAFAVLLLTASSPFLYYQF
jgi:alginate O-acetyltransferase complex protein AlgI